VARHSCEVICVVTSENNWAGNYTYRSTRLHEPATVDELRKIVSTAPKIHALGSRHSFNDIADSAELVSLERLDDAIEIDWEAGTVTVSGGIRYGTLAQALEREHLALHNMASLPHISVAGAIATATHGSGDGNGNLASAVAAIELVTSDGDVVRAARGDANFNGMVVHLGALGIVTRITLDVQPSYQVRQQVFEHLAWDVAFDRFDEIMASATSVSLFTDYGDTIDNVWLKNRVGPDQPMPLLDSFMGATQAPQSRHPVPVLSGECCTEQLGVPGAWCDRLPHFRADSVPAGGDDIQAEYMLPRQHAVPALRELRKLAHLIGPHLMISEVRTVAADDLWLSTAYHTGSVCIHFSWKPDQAAVERILPEIETVLEPFLPRPHWGKMFNADAGVLENRYERLAEFRALAKNLDPRGAFRNDFLDRRVFG